MATRGISFFARPHEFAKILNEIIIDLKLHAVSAVRMRNEKIKMLDIPLDINILTQPTIFDIFLTEHKVENGILVADVNRAKEGWIQVVLPKEANGMLFEGNIGIKTDWYDEETNAIYDKKEKLSLFNKIARRLKKNFKYPVIGYDIRTGKSHTYQIGYTEEAKRFLKEGGQLVSGINETDIGTVRFAIDQGDIRIEPSYQPKQQGKT